MVNMKKILFVGGELQSLNSFQEKLVERGYEVIIVYDGEEGLQTARSENPDLIILDIKKYVAADYARFKEFRLDEQINHAPIIICMPENDEDNSQLAGADDYIRKPFDESQLLAKIEILLDKPSNKTPVKEEAPTEGKRKSPRLKKDVIIDFKLVNAPGEYQMGKSVDISLVGVKLEAVCGDGPPTKGQYIEMVFKGAGPLDAVKVLGEVMWVENTKFSLNIKMGVKFIFISDGDAEKMMELFK